MPVSSFYQVDLAVLHEQVRQHEIAQAHLSGRNIKFDGTNLAEADVIALPEPIGNLSTLEFAHLFCIFNGSRVHEQVQKGLGSDDAPPGLYITVNNRQLLQSKNRSGVFREATSQAGLFIHGLHIDHFFLRTERSGAGLGTIAIALSAITALLRGLSTISLIAAGGKSHNKNHVGFDVWPKLGFDAKILGEELHGVPHLQGCQSVQDIIRVDPEWWALNGSQRLMTFDLAADSISWRKLISYVHARVLSGEVK